MRDRLRELDDLALDDHSAALDSVQHYIEAELEELRRAVPAGRSRSGPPSDP